MKKNFWSNIPDKLKTELEGLYTIKRYSKTSIVFTDMDDFRGFYVVKEGKFKVYNLNENGKEAILRFLEVGEMIAAPLIFTGVRKYPAYLESIEDGSLYFFEANLFKKFLSKYPEFHSTFISLAMETVHYLKNKTSSLMLLNLKERIIEYIREHGGEKKFIRLPVSKNQLALLLDATPESISRCFKALEQEQQIEVKDDTYKLVEPK